MRRMTDPPARSDVETRAAEIPKLEAPPERTADVLAERQELADRFAAREDEPEPVAVSPPRRSPRDLEKEIQRAQRERMLEIAEQQAQRLAEVRSAVAQGRRPEPSTAEPVLSEDESLPIDQDGELAGDPNLFQRWVTLRGSDGRENDKRATMFQRAGFRAARSRSDGKPIVGPFGILMEATPEAEGRRQAAWLHRIQPATVGAAAEDTLLAQGRKAGVAVFRADEAHGPEAPPPRP